MFADKALSSLLAPLYNLSLDPGAGALCEVTWV